MAAEADREVAARFGVSPETIAALRKGKLVEGDHWKNEARTVIYTDDGIAELARLLDAQPVPPEKKEGGAADGEAQAPGNECLILQLCPNPVFVRVRTPGGETVPVQVRNNKVLRTGQQLLCKSAADGKWICVHPGAEPRR